MLAERTIHLCVTGGIAAYKAVALARALIKAGARVRVAMTQSATAFVGPITFQAVTSGPVLTRVLDPSEEMEIGHIAFAQECDVLVVAPATANIIGKAANGIGDEVVSTVLLAANGPVLVAPAMNTFMYENPAVQANLDRLRQRGWAVLPPDSGELACGHVGLGRLPEPTVVVEAVAALLAPPILAGRHVVVSAGPTREYLDPVRFLSNPSTGRSGFAIAAAAARAGAKVTLVHGPVSLSTPAGVDAVPVISAEDMDAAITAAAEDADAVIMTAAVADWRPETRAEAKQKKSGTERTVKFVRTPDVLAGLGARRTGPRPILVGYAAETEALLESARAKRMRKGVDMVVANDVSRPGCGFASETNQVWFVGTEGEEALPMLRKTEIGQRLIAWLADALETSE